MWQNDLNVSDFISSLAFIGAMCAIGFIVAAVIEAIKQ